MNNKILSTVLFLGIFFTSCKNEPKTRARDGFTVIGKVTGLDQSYAKLSEYTFFDQGKAKVLDSVPVVEGKFEFRGKVEYPDMVMLSLGKFLGKFVLENGKIELTVDATRLSDSNIWFEPEVRGSKSHDEYAAVQEKQKAVFDSKKYKPLEEIRVLYGEAKKTKSDEILKKAEERQNELRYLLEERNEEYNSVIYDYVRQNPGSPLAPHIMGVNYSEGKMSRELLREFYELFQGDARKTAFFKNYITKIYQDNFENLGVGNIAPDFTLNTIDGKQLTLSRIEGNYMLVDFWASWCIPCRASFPHLKELRKKYGKDGFRIVGVGTADERPKWKKAIEEDQTPWFHVYDEGNEDKKNAYGPVAKSYGVPHLPTTFLVDSNRKIVLRNPSQEELDAKLEELFGY